MLHSNAAMVYTALQDCICLALGFVLKFSVIQHKKSTSNENFFYTTCPDSSQLTNNYLSQSYSSLKRSQE